MLKTNRKIPEIRNKTVNKRTRFVWDKGNSKYHISNDKEKKSSKFDLMNGKSLLLRI